MTPAEVERALEEIKNHLAKQAMNQERKLSQIEGEREVAFAISRAYAPTASDQESMNALTILQMIGIDVIKEAQDARAARAAEAVMQPGDIQEPAA